MIEINEKKDVCKNYKNGNCTTGCYEEKQLKNTPCPYDYDEMKHCSCYKK